MYLVLSAFTSSLVSLLATTKASEYEYEHHQHKQESDVYHLIPNHPGLPEPS